MVDKMRFSYGDAWDTYPVKFGQSWSVHGDGVTATFICADLLDFDFGRINLNSTDGGFWVYTDPPWGNSAVTSFKNKAMDSGVNPVGSLD